MTLKAIGIDYWPRPLISATVSATGLAKTAMTFNSATNRIAYVGRSPIADSIAHIYMRTSVVTTGDTVLVQIESVANGRPNGIIAAGANITVAIADTDDNVWKNAAIGTPFTFSAGQEFAIVVTHSSGATPNEQFCQAPELNEFLDAQYPLLLQDTGAGTWAAPTTYQPFEWIIEYTGAGIYPFPGLSPCDGAGVITAFNSGSSPNEFAAKIVPPMKCRCIGIRVFIQNVAAGANFTLSLWPSSSSVDGDALGQAALNGNFALTITRDGYVDLFFAPVTLTAGQTYYVGARADTANNLSVATLTTAGTGEPATAMQAFPVSSSACVLATRTWTAGTAGAWSPTTTTLPLISIIIDKLDDGLGGGPFYKPVLRMG